MYQKKIHLINQKKSNKVIAKFTDRREARKLFKESYKFRNAQISKERTPLVINYYGIGGVGKSRLSQELQNMTSSKSNFLFFSIDFKDPSLRTLPRALLRMRTEYKSHKKITFKHFDIAYAIYFAKKNPDIVFNEKNMPLFEELGVVGDILSLFDNVGFISSITSLTNWIYKIISKDKINSEVKDTLIKLPNLTLPEIENYLLALFSYDLLNNTSKDKNFTPIIFLDTFEYINEINKIDFWVKDLIVNIPFSLFIITGRNKLNWYKEDKDWNNFIKNELIEFLDKEDINQLLNSVNIIDKKIVNAIVNSTSGHPYYINLCIDLYHESIKKNVVPNFNSSKNDLYKLFAQTIEKDLLNLLKIISIANYCTEELYFFIVKNLNISISYIEYTEIENYSFITLTKGKLYIHDLMKESLFHSISKSLLNKYIFTINNYYKDKLQNIKESELIELVEDNLNESFHIICKTNNSKEIYYWLNKYSEKALNRLQLGGSSNFIINILNRIEKNIYPLSLPIKYQYMKIDMIHLQGNYEKAVKYLDKILKDVKEDELLTNNDLTFLEIRKIHHQMMFQPVKPLIKRTKWILNNRKSNNFDKVYFELNFLLNGNLGSLRGKNKKFRKSLYLLYKKSKELNNYKMTYRIIRKYIDFVKIRKHFTLAETILRNTINNAQEEGIERYLIYLKCTLADVLKEKKQYKEARKEFLEVRKMAIERNIQGWIGHTYLGLSTTYLKEKKYTKSLKTIIKAEGYYNKTNQAWGNLQVKIVKTIINKELNRKKWKTEARNCHREAIKLGYLNEINFCKKLIHKQSTETEYFLLFI